jgi:hypothetical protein
MTDLEIVLMFSLGVMIYLWKKATKSAEWFSGVLVAVGLGEVKIIVNKENKTYTVEGV